MSKKIVFILSMCLFINNFSFAENGTLRLGVEIGWSPIELEAEDTAQKIANASGSTVTTEYDVGVFVGRIFGEYGISEDLYLDAGYFQTSGGEATYKIGTDSAKETYDAHGFDISTVMKDDSGFFGKLGFHSSTIDGLATVTIGGTSYSATGEASGTGLLFGAGFEVDDTRYSLTRYNDVGGVSDFTFFSAGILF